MKITLKTIAACALLACTTATFAAGNHAGGHAHGPEKAQSIGEAGVAANVTRTVEVDMSDAMRFTPATIQAKQGETIRFVVKNSGKLGHEFVLGTEKDLKAHYEVMKKNPHMEHAEDNMLTVAPGQSGELLWRFTRAGTVDFACLQPGHYDAGMKGAVAVASSGQSGKPAMGMSGTNGMTKVNDVSSPAPKMDMTGMEMSSGEVKKIDKETQKITLKHGPIKNLDMPGMTMVFKVLDPSLLDKVKAGDTVKFTAQDQSGELLWRFTRAGAVDFACLQPGHYDAGMKGAVAVASSGQSAKPAMGMGGLAKVSDVASPAPKMDMAGMDMSSGEVKKVDKEAQKVTLKHGPIKNLDMPGMTMVFKVADPSLLDKVKAGDTVKFTAEDRGGAIVVTAIETAK